MKNPFVYRNIRARELFEIFLLSAVGSLLLVRFYLHVAGYPQVGGGGLHIAHMLWGGLLMASAFLINMAFLGMRAQRLVALLAGAGFGIFIDEIGKFITSDNNYFFRPAVGIIYAIFVIMYLGFNFVSRERRLTSREYQLNALMQLEEAIMHHMDPAEKERVRWLLGHADKRSLMTAKLAELVDTVQPIPEDQPWWLAKALARADASYTRFWQQRSSHPLVRTFFILETIIFVVIVSWGIFESLDEVTHLFTTGTAPYDFWLFLGQILSSVAAAAYALYGAVLLRVSRVRAFEQFRRATLINLFLTEFFIFSRVEFHAIPGFVFNVGVLLFITYVLHQEHRHGNHF